MEKGVLSLPSPLTCTEVAAAEEGGGGGGGGCGGLTSVSPEACKAGGGEQKGKFLQLAAAC